MLARLSKRLAEWWERIVSGTVIRTERLLLREWQEYDWEDVHRYRSDPEVLTYLDRTEPYSQEEIYEAIRARRWMQMRTPRYAYDLAIVLPGADQVIGEIGLVVGERAGEAYLGFVLHREQWGRGYATEAARAMLRFGFEQLKLAKVIAGCTPGNDASRNVLEKLNMRPLGPRKGFPGAPYGVDALVFEVTRDEWQTRGIAAE